jgi:amidase
MGNVSVEKGANIGFRGAYELSRMLRDKEISSVELTKYFIGRIERFDGPLNAVVVRDFDRALTAAKAADAALARGEKVGALHGVPMTIKESFDLAGHPTTWGVPAFSTNVASEDAEIVTRYKAAGAHFLGKTNVPLMLNDYQTYNAVYGVTNNPWDTARAPGGSSGGAAVALATGLTGMETGSDLAGSIRNPSHYCGVYGHKPTFGVLPQRGHGCPAFHGASDLVVVGPMARTADDLALAFQVTAGADPLDAAWRLEAPAPRATTLRGLRVAVWPTDPMAPVDTVVADRVQEVADLLAKKGAIVSDKARPCFELGGMLQTYLTLLGSLGAVPPDMPKPPLDHYAWLAARRVQSLLREAWNAFYAEWDVLLCPIMATTAFAHDHSPIETRTIPVNGAPQPYFLQIFWPSLATVGNLPSTIFPTGVTKAGLPLGLQAIGREFDDRTTIEFARMMAREIGGFVAPKGFAD